MIQNLMSSETLAKTMTCHLSFLNDTGSNAMLMVSVSLRETSALDTFLFVHYDCGVFGTTFIGSSYDSSSSPSVLIYDIPHWGEVGSLFPSPVLLPFETIP